MSITQLLSQANEHGIRLWEENGQLKYSAPRGGFPESIKKRIIAQREEILKILKKVKKGGDLKQSTERIIPVHSDHLPLSFSQQRLWLVDQMEHDNSAYNIPTAVRLNGQLDMQALEKSINTIIERHEVLRTVFTSENGRTFQNVLPAMRMKIPNVDLRGEPRTERIPISQKLFHEMASIPFDLGKGPLLRVQLVTLRENEYTLFLILHHVISDDWSLKVFVNEIAALYRAFKENKNHVLPDLSIQYGDYSHWQRSWLESGGADEQIEYWRERLRGCDSLPGFPGDFPRSDTKSYNGLREYSMLDSAILSGLKDVSRKAGCTLYVTLLSVFNVLLYQYTGFKEIVIGSPVSGRNRREVENLIGYFINTVVLRTEIIDGMLFSDLLQQVKSTILEALANQDVPLEMLIEELKPKYEMNTTPFFQVLFNMLNTSFRIELPGLEILPLTEYIIGAPNIGAKLDLTLLAIELPDKMQLDFSYNTDLFSKETIRWLLEHLKNLLTTVAGNPDLPLSELPRLFPRPVKRIEPQNAFTPFLKKNIERPINRIFEQRVQEDPEGIALQFEDRTISYAELNRLSNKLARLISESGWLSLQQASSMSVMEAQASNIPAKTKVGTGNRTDNHSGTEQQIVALLLGKNANMVKGILASLKAGNAFAVLDPNYPIERLIYIAEDTATMLIIHDNRTQALAAEIRDRIDTGIRILNADDLPGGIPDSDLEYEASSGSLAYIVYTSGSMGKPKGVMQTQRNVLHYIMNYVNGLHICKGDRISLIASFSFSAAMMDTFASLVRGATLLPYDVENRGLDNLAQWLVDNRISVYHSVPTVFRNFLINLREETSFPDLRIIDLGGEAVTSREIELYKKHFAPHCLLVNGLGATELNVIRQYILDKDTVLPNRRIPVGYEVEDTEIILVDEHGRKVGFNRPGEIVIRSEYLSPGYWRLDEQTREFFKEEHDGRTRLFFTGDLGQVDTGGNLMHLGRKDLQVKIRGVRIEPAEIETVLAEHPAISEAVILAEENGDRDKQLTAYIVEEGNGYISMEEIRDFLKSRLPSYMFPQSMKKVKSFPQTTTGKIDRKALSTLDGILINGTYGKPQYEAPLNEMEKALAGIWQKVLGVERIGIHDDFFELGGNSISMIRIVSLAAEKGIAFEVRDIYNHSTVGDLGKICRQEIKPVNSRPVAYDFGEDAQKVKEMIANDANIEYINPLSPMQLATIADCIMKYRNGKNSTVQGYTIRGINIGTFEQAWSEIVMRYDILRTSFKWRGLSEPIQVTYREISPCIKSFDFSGLHEKERMKSINDLLASEDSTGIKVDGTHLVRMTIGRLSETDCFVICSMLFSLLDGWSINILIRNLMREYIDISRGGKTSNGTVNSNTEYIKWIIRQNEDDARQYWIDELGDFNHASVMVESRNTGYRMSSYSTHLSEDTVKRIMDLSKKNGITLNTVVVGCWSLMLASETNTEDTIVCIVTSGRPAEMKDIDGMVGHFSNVVPLRIKIDPHNSKLDFFRYISQKIAGMSRYEYVNIQQITKWVKMPSNRLSWIIGNNTVNYFNFPSIEDSKLENIEIEELYNPTPIPHERRLYVSDDFTLKLSFNENSYNRYQIENMLDRLIKIFDSSDSISRILTTLQNHGIQGKHSTPENRENK